MKLKKWVKVTLTIIAIIIAVIIFIASEKEDRKMIKNCINCGIPMVGVMSFSKNKHERFCRCPKCYSESRHRRVNDDELDFGEILHRNVIKNNTRK